MLSEQDYNLIDKYFRLELTGDENVLMEQRLLDDVFAAEFKEFEIIQHGVTSSGRQELRNYLKVWDRVEHTKPQKANFHIKLLRWASVGSAAALLAVVIIFGLPKSEQQLYAEFIQAYPNIISPIQKGQQEATTDYQKAFQLYESGNYDHALKQFDLLPQPDPAVEFYTAMSHMLNENFSVAKAIFEEILKEDDHRFYPQAQWYRMMIDIRLNNRIDAMEQLQSIVEIRDHIFQGKAKVLLDKLQKDWQ